MTQIEEIETNRKATDLKNKALMKVLYNTLNSTYNQIGCYGDCESCVLGSKKKDECLESDINRLKNKISKLIDISEIEE